MKLALFAVLLAACASSAPPPAPAPRTVMVVDRTYDRSQPQPGADNEIPAASSGVPVASSERGKIVTK